MVKLKGVDGSRFKSENNRWATPSSLFKRLDDEFHFTIDLAADSENTKCTTFFSSEDDALEQDWYGTCWLNPPFGETGKNKLKLWVKKAHEEYKKHGGIIVVLVPARTNTNWWHDYCHKAKEVRFIKGRPAFDGCKYGLMQPLAIVIFAPHGSESATMTTQEFIFMTDNNKGHPTAPSLKQPNDGRLKNDRRREYIEKRGEK